MLVLYMTKRISKIPYGAGSIEGEDLKYTTRREDWNLYELEDGTLLKIKIIANKISRGIDPETGDILRVEKTGEPFYNVNYKIIVTAEVAENLMRTQA